MSIYLQHLKVSHFTFINFIMLAGLICIVTLSVNAQSSVGVKTDSGAYPEGSPPPLPAAGGKLTDSTFGTQIMRVTDNSDGTNFGTSYSYWSSFNENNSRILIGNDPGNSFLRNFNPTAFTLGAKTPLPAPPSSIYSTFQDAIWSRLQPNVLFVHSDAKIYALNTAATPMTYSVYTDFTSRLPVNAYVFQMSASSNDDVFAFTVKNGGTWAYLGYGVWKRSTSEMYYVAGQASDEVQIDKTGRWLVNRTGNQGAGIIEAQVIDLQANPKTIVNLTDDAPDQAPGGHSDMGMRTTVGMANYANGITFRSLAAPHAFTNIFSFGTDYFNGGHVSLLSNNEDWVLVSSYGAERSKAFNNELFFVATDGSRRVKRFVHHYSRYQLYYDSPRANVSRDGKFVAFTSNWGGSGRLDLFIAKVPAEAVPAPVPTPTSAMTNALFENVSGFCLKSSNFLDKLFAPYFLKNKFIAAESEIAGF